MRPPRTSFLRAKENLQIYKTRGFASREGKAVTDVVFFQPAKGTYERAFSTDLYFASLRVNDPTVRTAGERRMVGAR